MGSWDCRGAPAARCEIPTKRQSVVTITEIFIKGSFPTLEFRVDSVLSCRLFSVSWGELLARICTTEAQMIHRAAERTQQIRNSSYRNRKRQKAKHKNNHGDNPNNNARPAERLHLLRFRMANAEHDCQQQNENEPRRAVVPNPAQN